MTLLVLIALTFIFQVENIKISGEESNIGADNFKHSDFFKVLIYVFERQNEKGRESMCEQRVKERKGKKEGGR